MKFPLQTKPSAIYLFIFSFFIYLLYFLFFNYQEDGITDYVGDEMGRNRVNLMLSGISKMTLA